jgi:hypothetical protein
MSVRSTSALTEEQVIRILDMLDSGVLPRVIAEEFGVSRKAICRIHTGRTWRELTTRYNKEKPGQVTMLGLPIKFCELHDEVTAVKNHFGLSFKQPIYWGWFESWDGLHSVVSDGYIIWESTDLVKYAQKLADTGITGDPVWADKVEELPTFELEDIMSMPTGRKFKIEPCENGIVKLSTKYRCLHIQQKYVDIAAKMKLEIREAYRSDNLVYFTRTKPKSIINPTHVVIACCSTLEV